MAFHPALSLATSALAWQLSKQETIEERMLVFGDWARRSNKFLLKALVDQPIVWDQLETGEIGCFLLDLRCSTTEGPYPRAVCGTIAGTGRVCTNGRGYKTEHPGFGSCRFCENKKESKQRETIRSFTPLTEANRSMHILNRSNHVPSRLAECLVAAEQIEEGSLQNLDGDIQMMYGLIQYIFEGGLQDLEEADRDAAVWRLRTDDVKMLNTMFRTLLDAKKTRHSMENELRLDPVTIKAFVGQVLAIVFKNTDARMARKIGAEVLDKVIRPFREEGKLSGSEEEYESVGGAMVNAVAKYSGVDPEEVEGLNKTAPDGEIDPALARQVGTTRDLIRDVQSSVSGLHDTAGQTEFASDKVQRRAKRRMEQRKQELNS